MSPRRQAVDPNRPYRLIDEREPDGHGGVADVRTLFLTASECPIGCSMCDLWQWTLTEPTPPRAIVRQIDHALSQPGSGQASRRWLKLYNSGNFFDPASVPPSDHDAIGERVADHERVIVENHPRMGRRLIEPFARRLNGRLEIAVGLETVQPRQLDRMGKRMSRDDFDAYARFLRSIDVDLRVFLIVGVPGASVRESFRWARLSVRHALAAGARHVSVIPARPGHGWNGAGDRLPRFRVVDLKRLLEDMLGDVRGRGVVMVDAWDLDPDAAGHDELVTMNRSQTIAV